MWPLYNKKFIIINPSAMNVTNFVSKIDKKVYFEGSISPIKKPKWLYCKIETQGGQFANDPNPRRWLCNLALIWLSLWNIIQEESPHEVIFYFRFIFQVSSPWRTATAVLSDCERSATRFSGCYMKLVQATNLFLSFKGSEVTSGGRHERANKR
jgi:hypothetical protein